MKKKKRVLGIRNPDALDYILAIIFALITAGAIWLGAWISQNNAYPTSNQAWQNFVDSFTLQFEKVFSWQGLICSFLIYLSVVFGIVLVFASIFKKSFRGVVGAVNVMLCGVSGSLFFSFFYYFANPVKTNITGIFPIGLLIICVIFLYFAKLSIDLSISYMNEKANKEEEERPIQYVYVNQVNNEPSEYVEEEYIPQEVNEPITESNEENGFPKINAQKLTFEEKLERANEDVKSKFEELKAYFEEIGFRCKITKHSANFYHKNVKHALITVSGKSSLKAYYKLDYSKYENSSMPLTYVADVKKYESTPVYIKVKSDLSVKRAKKLIDDVFSQFTE